MFRNLLKWVFLFSLITLLLAACNPSGPDLIPERRSGSQGAEGYCRREDSNLMVRVRNQSNEDVFVQTTTTVTFSPGGTESVSTAPMPGGSMTDVTVPIPSACFNPDCDFAITVDVDNEVEEAVENNNTADGTCIG